MNGWQIDLIQNIINWSAGQWAGQIAVPDGIIDPTYQQCFEIVKSLIDPEVLKAIEEIEGQQ